MTVKEKTVSIKLNAWELLAIEKSLEDFQKTDKHSGTY